MVNSRNKKKNIYMINDVYTLMKKLGLPTKAFKAYFIS